MRTKYERIAARAGIRPGDRVLEIGCGWGAMAEYAAGELGCTVTAVTISHEQHDYVVRRMKEAGPRRSCRSSADRLPRTSKANTTG